MLRIYSADIIIKCVKNFISNDDYLVASKDKEYNFYTRSDIPNKMFFVDEYTCIRSLNKPYMKEYFNYNIA